MKKCKVKKAAKKIAELPFDFRHLGESLQSPESKCAEKLLAKAIIDLKKLPGAKAVFCVVLGKDGVHSDANGRPVEVLGAITAANHHFIKRKFY